MNYYSIRVGGGTEVRCPSGHFGAIRTCLLRGSREVTSWTQCEVCGSSAPQTMVDVVRQLARSPRLELRAIAIDVAQSFAEKGGLLVVRL